jgi:hypothetical protein
MSNNTVRVPALNQAVAMLMLAVLAVVVVVVLC